MSVLKYFKNIHRSPSHRATDLKCNFFFQIRNEVPGKKRPCRPALGRQGPVARWGGRQGLFFPGTYFELFERVVVIIVGRISAANSYRT